MLLLLLHMLPAYFISRDDEVSGRRVVNNNTIVSLSRKRRLPHESLVCSLSRSRSLILSPGRVSRSVRSPTRDAGAGDGAGNGRH